jgi:hypothetical protein
MSTKFGRSGGGYKRQSKDRWDDAVGSVDFGGAALNDGAMTAADEAAKLRVPEPDSVRQKIPKKRG